MYPDMDMSRRCALKSHFNVILQNRFPVHFWVVSYLDLGVVMRWSTSCFFFLFYAKIIDH